MNAVARPYSVECDTFPEYSCTVLVRHFVLQERPLDESISFPVPFHCLERLEVLGTEY